MLASAPSGRGGPPFLVPPAADLHAPPIEGDDVESARSRRADLFRALYRLRGFPTPISTSSGRSSRGIFSHLRETEASLAAYREAKASRARDPGRLRPQLPRDRAAGAGGRGLARHGGGQQHRRAGRAAGAGGRHASPAAISRCGSTPRDDPEEIAVLVPCLQPHDARSCRRSRTRCAPRTTEAESRRQFIETVLFGVSAGVIGLDPAGPHLGGQPPGRQPARAAARRAIGRPLARAGAGVPGRVAAARRGAGVRGRGGRRRRARRRIAAAARARQPQPRRPGADLRRHHPPGRRPAQRRLAGRRPPHRPRDQEPADADPALGRAAAAQVPQARSPATWRPSTAAPTPSSARSATSAAWSTSSPPSPACRRRSSPRTDAAELLRQAVFAQRVADPETPDRDRRAAGRRSACSATAA